MRYTGIKYHIGYEVELVIEKEKLIARWCDPHKVHNDNWGLNSCFKLAMRVFQHILDESSHKLKPFFWANGRVVWSVGEATAIVKHMGLINFLDSIGGGCSISRCSNSYDILEIYMNYIDGKGDDDLVIHSDPDGVILEWMKDNLKEFRMLEQRRVGFDGNEDDFVYLILEKENGEYSEHY